MKVRIVYISIFFCLFQMSCKEEIYLLPEGKPISAKSAKEDIQSGNFRILMAGESPPSDTIVIEAGLQKITLARISVAGCLVEEGLLKQVNDYNKTMDNYLNSIGITGY